MVKKEFFQRVFMVMLLAVLGYSQVSAATYYAKCIVKVSSSGGGKVFVSTTNSTDGAEWAETSEVLRTGSARSSSFYLFAQAEEGYEFDHWATADNSNTSASKNNPWTYTFNAGTTATSEARATTNTRYAVFKKTQNFYSTLTVNALEGGKVFASTENSSEDAVWSTTSTVDQTTAAITAPSPNYYLFAEAQDGWDFIGWSTTADGAVVSKNNPYTASVKAESTDEAAPTAATYYAKFAQAVNHYSQAIATVQEGGNVFVSTTNSSADAEWATTSTASNTSLNAEPPTHTYYYYAQVAEDYVFRGWMKEGTTTIVSTANPYTVTVSAESVDAENPSSVTYVPKFVTYAPHYSKVIAKLAGNNDVAHLGTAVVGGKVYVGRSDSETPDFAYTSEGTQSSVAYSDEAVSHEYYLYAEAEEGFEFAGWSTATGVVTSFNSTANPYKPTALSVTSVDESAPTEKIYYAAFKYAADNKPSVCYANFTVVTNVVVTDENNKQTTVEDANAAQVGIVYGENQTTCDDWHQGTYTSEAYSLPYTSGTVKFPFTLFVKPALGYEFLGWATSSSTVAPTSSNKGTNVDDYNYYYSSTNSNNSISSNTYPGQCGLENGPKNKKMYAVFKKLEQMDEPTGTTSVEFTSVSGTTELAEGSVTKNFSVDLVLNEELPYDVPGSDKNPKPNGVLTQFVTVLGANGNKSSVVNYSLVYESTDLGQGSEESGDLSYGTLYSCSTIRLYFPYDIKADTYTVHLPYGLYTTKAGNKTPTYEFTITVTADENPHLTIKKQTPVEGLTYKYTSPGSQFSEDKRDPEKGLVSESNITVAIEFNEIVASIDESKKAGIILTNTTAGVNYKPISVVRDAALFGKVSGAVSIAYPELVNGSYTVTIPAGLFVGATDKVNEEITIHFTVTGFSSVQLKPYEMITDQITPKANDMITMLDELSDITVSYQGEFGGAAAVIGNASGINVRRYTEEIQGEGEGAKPVRTYYSVTTTPSVSVVDGKMKVSFTPALYDGNFEVTIPAGMVANMEPGSMTMAEKVNAGYAESPAYTMTFKVNKKLIRGDVNQDDQLSLVDAVLLINYLLTGDHTHCDLKAADVNGDTIIDTQDVQALVSALVSE